MTKNKTRTMIFVGVALVLALGAFALAWPDRASAIEPGKYFVAGNPSCATLNADAFFDNITSDFGFKIDGAPTQGMTYYLTNAYGSLTGGAPSDPTNYVTFPNVMNPYFDWEASLGIDAVIVKGGPNADAYVYVPEAYLGGPLSPPTNPSTGQPYGISHVEFCYDYELTATKTADATWYKTIDWTLTKDVTPASADRFIGQSAQYDYTVTLTKNETFGPYIVDGTITVSNPTPYDVTFSVEDYVATTLAAVTCTTYSLAPGASTTCTYSANLASNTDGTNTATITSLNLNVKGATATDGYAFGAPMLTSGSEPETVTASDTIGGPLGSFSASGVVNYSLTQTCSSDPADYAGDGHWSNTYPNTASINETTGDSDSETVTLNCYAPVMSKDATATWYRDVEWSITKDVSPASVSAFIGGSGTYNYTVTLTKWESDEYDVSGTINVANPAGSPGNMTVSLVDMLDATTSATVDCGSGATSVTVAPGATGSCSYTGDLAAKADGTNTATGTFMGYGFVATYPYAFGSPTYLQGSEPETVTANDTLKGALGSFSSTQVVNYSLTQDCSADPADYAGDGQWSKTYPNTASINETTGDSDSETVRLNCYAPLVSKDAFGSYDEVHDWEVFKSVNTASQTAWAGQKKNFTWTVRVEETTHGENYLVEGDITVVNPNPDSAMTVNLSDVLNDGSVATIGPCTFVPVGGTWSDPNLTIPAGGTATCDYSVVPGGNLDALAAALPVQVTMKVQYPVAGGSAYFPVTTISGGTALDGTYEGWCVDTDHTIANNTNYIANVYSSYESLPAGLVEHPENFDLVNWIINQDFVGKASPGGYGIYTYGDVQRSIWTLIEDNNSTSGLGSWNQNRVNEIVAAAMANGEGFTPTCGDMVAVVLEPVGGQQLVTIAQVTFASLGVDCAESNAVTAVLNGIGFPASADIIWSVTKINETAQLDDDQKLDWPITVSADSTFTYQDPQGYTCSSNPADYVAGNGFYQYNESNTAVLTFDTGSDTATASTVVKCYAPVVTKDAT